MNDCISSIERLDVESNAKAWELFKFNEIKGVQCPIICALNLSEILIAGGTFHNSIGKQVGESYDAYILNVAQMAVRNVSIDRMDFCAGRAVMIVPGKVLWIFGDCNVHLYDSTTETIENIYGF